MYSKHEQNDMYAAQSNQQVYEKLNTKVMGMYNQEIVKQQIKPDSKAQFSNFIQHLNKIIWQIPSKGFSVHTHI